MGCSGLCSYVHKNFHIFGRIHNHQPLDVVIDATNAMFFFHNILSYKNVINGYNVDFLENAIDAFFYFLEYNNFHITHIVFDGVVDWDKVDEFAVREDKNKEDNEKIWESGLNNSADKNERFYMSLFYEYHFLKIIKKRFSLDKIIYTGVHADRGKARIAIEDHACIMSADSDMFVLEEYGVIFYGDIIKRSVLYAKCIISEEEFLDTEIVIYSKQESNITTEQFAYTGIVNGNDYFHYEVIKHEEGEERIQKPQLEWSDCIENPKTAEECRKQFQEYVHDDERYMKMFDIAWKKYDLDQYPEFPYNYLCDSKRVLEDDIENLKISKDDIIRIINSIEKDYTVTIKYSVYFSLGTITTLFPSFEFIDTCKDCDNSYEIIVSEARDKIQHRIKKILRNKVKIKVEKNEEVEEEEKKEEEEVEWDLLGHPCRTLSSVLQKYLTCRNSSCSDKMKFIQYVFDFDDYSNIDFEIFKEDLEEENSDENKDEKKELDEEEIRKKYLEKVAKLKWSWNIHADDLIIDKDYNEKQKNYLESEENSKRFFNKYVLILVQLFLKQCKVDYKEINTFVNYLKRLIDYPSSNCLSMQKGKQEFTASQKKEAILMIDCVCLAYRVLDLLYNILDLTPDFTIMDRMRIEDIMTLF